MATVVIIPQTGRSPFQIYLISLITVSGLALATGISSNMITEKMGTPYTQIWGAFLAIGGLLTLIGVYWPREETITGLLIERTGLVALGGASFIWSVLVVWRVHMSGVFSASLTFGLFLACFRQWRWVNKNVNKVIRAIHEQ